MCVLVPDPSFQPLPRVLDLDRHLESNLEPNEEITEDSPWRVLILDAFEAHLSEDVYKEGSRASPESRFVIRVPAPSSPRCNVKECDNL